MESAESTINTLSAEIGTALEGTPGTVTTAELIVNRSPAAFPIVVLPLRNAFPATVRLFPQLMNPPAPLVTIEEVVDIPPERVESPVTLRVLPRDTAPGTENPPVKVARLLKLVSELKVTEELLKTVVPAIVLFAPLLLWVKLPYTDRLPPLVEMLLLTASVEERVVAPVTPRVPAIWVFPLADATVNLLVATEKFPTLLIAAVEIWSEESFPLPSVMVRRLELRTVLSVVLSRPV